MVTSLETIEVLSSAKSITGGTSLVTLYVPGNSNLINVSSQLNKELSTSQNIKSKAVRDAVQSALKSGQHKIKSLSGHKTSENGFVLCCGEIKSCI